MLRGSLGQLLVNDALPEEMRDYNRVLDKKGLNALLRDVALKGTSEDYVRISKTLADIGREASTESGGNSVGLRHFRKSKIATANQAIIQAKIKQILARPDKSQDPVRGLTDDDREALIVKVTGEGQDKQMDDILQEALASDNPFAHQVISGARGNKASLASLLGSDRLYADHHDNVIPLPVWRSYSQGLTPMEYWAGTYGARKGVMATKFAVQEAGYLGKQLNQVSHRLMVTAHDADDYQDEANAKGVRGMPVATNDMDNEGALLATETGGYKRNTVLTPKIMKDLERRGIKDIVVRSPIVGGTPEGGVYARDVGVREYGTIPGRGEMVGLTAAQAHQY